MIEMRDVGFAYPRGGALFGGITLELPRERCLAALREFAGLPHRSQWVAEVGGVRYLDDSKGTNVGATVAALATVMPPYRLLPRRAR